MSTLLSVFRDFQHTKADEVLRPEYRSREPKRMLEDLIIPILLGYIIAGCLMMTFLRGVSGVMATIVIGWMFLPPSRGVNLPGLPAYTKEHAVSYALLIGMMLTGSSRILRYRPSLLDIAPVIWTIAPFFSSVTNGHGTYDGLSGVYSQFFLYTLPYLIGRLYIQSPLDVRIAAKWFVIAGLIALPFILWEVRMSPTINRFVYGYDASPFHAAKRLGGYRPLIFMRHGLEVGLWMSSSAVVAAWLMITMPKEVRVFGLTTRFHGIIILIATLLCRSTGAIVLLIGNLAAAVFTRATGIRAAIIALVLTPPVYLTVRYTNFWAPTDLTGLISSFDEQRASSLESRLNQELVITEHAMKKPLFGWGGYDQYRPLNDQGETEPVDGWTSITFGRNGLFGVISLECFVTLPSLLLVLGLKRQEITDPTWAPAIGILLACSIFSMDILFNAFPTSLHFFGIGAIATVSMKTKHWRRVLRNHAKAIRQSQQDPEECPPDPINHAHSTP